MAMGQTRIFRSVGNEVDLVKDGRALKGGWTVSPEINPDILHTTAREVKFISEIDTLVIDSLKEWESFDFVIVTNKGDSAYCRVVRDAVNPFENPNPELLKIAESGKLTKRQAQFDIDALIYGLSEVHPDIFSICNQADLMRAVNKAKESLPDSVTLLELYQAAAPVVAMIGDGHTNLIFPSKRVLTKELKRFPVFVDVLTDHSLICTSSLDSIISKGDKILSVNNISADSIVRAMMPYVSGERPHFKISRVDGAFNGLFQMLFPADEYTVSYQPAGSKKILTHTFPAIEWEEILKRCPTTRSGKKYEDYSFEIDSVNNVAVMDFRSFRDMEKMEQFADSMFRELKDKNITNLIIDVRNNGGGQSGVGDILLRYLSDEPFVQMDKALIRITPLTSKLMKSDMATPGLYFYEVDSTDFIKPLSAEEGHYEGDVYLLTSNHTFSSAGSFAWTFKECNMGKVIGEETGGMNVCYGDILRYRLPISRLQATVSFKRFWQLRADENDIHGTIPDIAVPAEDALDKAMKLIKKKH
ncbi:MAG: hypothetical protein K2J82_04250 [Muribaculaceae bacterium]|nr:hypothetical protein [Muribaculaceae bacterium]MDE6753808.1 hypothetical protein [Muribaculaceae bacterium]